ncbi:MAG: glycosyltransferase family 39 protein [Candidatus Bathyarchaeia archaeon]
MGLTLHGARRLLGTISFGDLPFLLFMIVYGFLLLRNLGYSSPAWDEAVQMQSGVDMSRLASTFFSNPVYMIKAYIKWYPYFPPLNAILLAFSYAFLGISELSARLVTVSLSLLGLVVVYFAGRKAWGRTAGIISTITLAATPTYFNMSRIAMVDIPETVFFALSLLLFYSGYEHKKYEQLILSGVFLAAAFLAKYPALLALPVMAAYILLRRFYFREGLSWRAIACLSLALELAFFLVLPWTYILTTTTTRWRGWYKQVEPGKEYKWLMAENWLGSFQVIIKQMTWILAVVAVLSLIYAFRSRKKVDLFLISWVAIVFLAFVPIHKDPRYTMLYLPAFALMIGRFIADAGKRVNVLFSRSSLLIARNGQIAQFLFIGVLIGLLTCPQFIGYSARPAGLNVPLYDAFQYVAPRTPSGSYVVVLLQCNYFSQPAAYFYLSMVGGHGIHIDAYPGRAVDWYDPGPLNITDLGEFCADKNVVYAILWSGSPYVDQWLPVLLNAHNFNLETKVGEPDNWIYIFKYLG